MNWKTKLKSPSFWTGIGGAVVMLLRAFGVEMGGETAEVIISLVCSGLVAIGIFRNSGNVKESIKKVSEVADTIADLSCDDEPAVTENDDGEFYSVTKAQEKSVKQKTKQSNKM